MPDRETQIREIFAALKPLAIKYYELMGRPLGVTGEIAEHVAADKLDLKLAGARQAGFDATSKTNGERIQIKGRIFGGGNPGQRLPRVNLNGECDSVLLVLLDSKTLDPREMWKADFVEVKAKIQSKTNNKRSDLAIREFTKMATKVWPTL